MIRWNTTGDRDGAFDMLENWMESQPSGFEGRRQMPQFNVTDEEIRDLGE